MDTKTQIRRGAAGALLTLAALGAITALPGPAAAATCDDLLEQARTARNDPGALRVLHGQAEDGCDLELVRRIAGALGIALYKRASQEPPAQAEKTLEEAIGFDRRWQFLAALGSLMSERGDWEGAATRYQEALIEIESLPSEAAPPDDDIAALLRKANAARGAAPVYVRALRTRSNEPGGIAAERLGGLEIEVIPFPIEFVFGESIMTDKGLVAALDMAEIIAAQRPHEITLVGHTDPVGSDAYNRKLSLQRAEAVRSFLYEQGVKGVLIKVDGRGEREPPQIDDPELFTTDELYQIARRVELKRR